MAKAKDDGQQPDFTQGVPFSSLKDGGTLLGRVNDDEVVLVRSGEELFAIGAHCTHYHGPLAEGLVVGDTVRCPWHHACFSLRTGDALRAPALDPIDCWRVEHVGDKVFVKEKLDVAIRPEPIPAYSRKTPDSVVIVGGGGAGLAAAQMLRREKYEGDVTIISADDAPPSDRPNLSKDYLAGEAREDWIPLRPEEFYMENRIDLVLKTRVTAIDKTAREVQLDSGERRRYGALLIATGAEPVHLPLSEADALTVYYLRSLADSNAIIAQARSGTRAVVIGASFIGLEVAASLRARKVSVDIVSPEKLPLERVLGAELGMVVRRLHEDHGVTFHLGETVKGVGSKSVLLSGGGSIEADFVVAGVGVRPLTELGEKAGLTIDRGIAVNEFLETSAPGIFAAGDVARWFDPASGERRRVEHWVVAERMGQIAAKNMLGRREAFDYAPFFWSQHYDMTIRFVGYAEGWDAVEVDGDLASHDCAVSYKRGGKTVALATISRDFENLRAEVALEGHRNFVTVEARKKIRRTESRD
jgi:NADPH-dependent 2,4-dienoyl-CoA reductase/sulfur reductase-like enzyme/nitrite reductase/ring-hydroxylating ferredoxin subunit